jgi:hypothetical protein
VLHPSDAITIIARRLDSLGIAWMLTGSVAAFFYGRERSTNDIDIVLDCEALAVGPFVAAFAPEWFLDIEMVRDSVHHGFMFNAIPTPGGPKIDFIPLQDDLFERTKFRRRVVQDWHGTPIQVCTGVDLVLSKLGRAKDNRSERQLGDIRAIMSSGLVEEDDEFSRWVGRLGLETALDASRATRYDEWSAGPDARL